MVLLLGGCSVRKPAFPTYRLVPKNPGFVLIPPGLATEAVPQRTLSIGAAPGAKPCPSTAAIATEVRKKRVFVTVQRDALLQQPAGWLSDWSAEMESRGCLAPGSGLSLAKRIVESLPLDPRTAFRLLYPDQLEITAPMKIEVASPILREGADPNAKLLEDVQTAGNGNSLTVTVKASADLIGVEIATYLVQTKPNGIGLSIVPVSAERQIPGRPGERNERRDQPSTDYFHFPPDAAFFRVFYEAEQTEYAALIVAARTRADLERRTKTLSAGPASCEAIGGELCRAVPKVVAINGLVPVTANGKETWVRWGATVGELLRTSGVSQPRSTLAVSKLFEGKPVAVEFDRSNPAILGLILTGGEIISW